MKPLSFLFFPIALALWPQLVLLLTHLIYLVVVVLMVAAHVIGYFLYYV